MVDTIGSWKESLVNSDHLYRKLDKTDEHTGKQKVQTTPHLSI